MTHVAFITSAAKGLGHAMVRCLLHAGWDVGFTYGESANEARDLIEEAESLGRVARGYQADLLSRDDVLSATLQCLTDFTKIDAFVHNFGPFVFDRVCLADYDDTMWERMFTGNLNNFFWIYREVASGMRKRGFGRIVTVGYDGAGGAAGWRYRAAYAGAKSGLAAITRSIAREERQNGITANMICPGDIRGHAKMELIHEVRRPEDPLGRPPVGEDVARTVVFLCHPDSGQVNGTVTEVTGGYDVLAYDDGTEIVRENVTFATGEEVYVYPWESIGQVRGIEKIPNRNVVYEIIGPNGHGHFTAYQLARLSGEE